MKFVCRACPTPVVLDDEPKHYSRDVRDQVALQLCTKCWNAHKAKETA
ncbi:hypothetical protein ACRQ5Q_14470 [Bradyrhizobium sp. PMVTL-01]